MKKVILCCSCLGMFLYVFGAFISSFVIVGVGTGFELVGLILLAIYKVIMLRNSDFTCRYNFTDEDLQLLYLSMLLNNRDLNESDS